MTQDILGIQKVGKELTAAHERGYSIATEAIEQDI